MYADKTQAARERIESSERLDAEATAKVTSSDELK